MTEQARAATRPALWRRAAAYSIDYLAIGTFAAGLAAVAWSLGAARLALGPWAGQLVGFSLLTGPVILIFSAFESSSWRGSPGKKVLGLYVQPARGTTSDPVSFSTALLRNAGKFLPWELSHGAIWQMRDGGWPALAVAFTLATWLLLGLYILGASRAAGQTLYDRWAGTVVRWYS